MRKFVVLCGLFCSLTGLKAQDTDDSLFLSVDTVRFDEIVVSVHRSPAVYREVSRMVSVIRSEDIRLLPSQSVQGFLEYEPGVDIRKRGPVGVQADVSIRGGTFEQTAVLLNGMRINNPQTGHHHLNLPVSDADIDRVEVLKGPGSRVFGPNAYGGAVNIITRGYEETSVTGSISGGEYGYFNAAASAQFKTGPAEHRISGSYGSSDGYMENTDFNSTNIFYSGEGEMGPLSLNLQGGYMEKGFGANSFYSPLYPEQYEKIRSGFAGLQVSGGERVKYTQSLYWKRHYDRYELFRHEAPDWYEGHNYHMTDVAAVDAGADIPWDHGMTSLGGELRMEQIYSSVLGEEMESSVPVRGEDAYYKYFKRRNSVNLFAEHTAYVGDFNLSGGVLASKSDRFSWKLFSGIDAGYRLSQHWRVFSSVNTSMRMPTFTEMYYEGPVNEGNPDLVPEEALTVEGGVKYNRRGVSGHLTFFRRKGENIIDWARKDDTMIWQTMNVTQLDTRGAEAGIEWRNPDFPDHFLRGVSFRYAYIDIDKQSREYISAYVLDHLRHKMVAGFNHRVGGTLNMSWQLRYEERAGTYTDFPSEKEKPYEPFWLADAKISYSRGDMTVYLEASNLFDTSYSDIGNIPQPGRWVKSGVSFRLDR